LIIAVQRLLCRALASELFLYPGADFAARDQDGPLVTSSLSRLQLLPPLTMPAASSARRSRQCPNSI